mgnify:CR=1 FL=1
MIKKIETAKSILEALPYIKKYANETFVIKSVFNELIMKLKEKEFEFNFQDTGNDLFTQIAKEYIKQLNTELESVHKELSDYDHTQ